MQVRGYTLPSAPRSATEPRSYRISQDVLVDGKKPYQPQPGGVYGINAPLNRKGYFTSEGIRQWNTGTAPSAGTTPTGSKARYDMMVRGMDDMILNAGTARVYTIQQEDSVLLGEQILNRAALREAETYDELIQQGLTHAEATKVIRDQMIARTMSGAGRSSRAYHQQMKEVVHQMAAERGVQVGLPQSLATFAGRHAPSAHFATSGIGAVKAALRQQIHDPLFNMRPREGYTQLYRARAQDEVARVAMPPPQNPAPPAAGGGGGSPRARRASTQESTGDYNKASLIEHLRELGLPTGGTVADLRARLEAATQGGGAPPAPRRARRASDLIIGVGPRGK